MTFDDGTETEVGATQIADFTLFAGREISAEEYAELRESAALGSSKVRAMRILGSRNMSARQVEERLVSKGESSEIARETVEWLERIGAVNDEEYASAIVRHYIAKGYGLARIKSELFKRGIERDLWEKALSDLEGMEEAAFDFVVNKLQGAHGKDDIRRATNALLGRGYSYDEVRAAVRRYLEETGDTMDGEE